MAQPGTTVVSLNKPAISFGATGGDATEKYGGFAYQLDYSLSFIDPSRVTVSFISEDGSYDEEALQADIWDPEGGTRFSPEAIQYCGGVRIFYGYPLKYSISKSPRGNILTVDYYDASIGELDNRFILLTGKDVPLENDNLAEEGIDDGSLISFKFIESIPCPERLITLGNQYVKTSTGIPQSGNTKCSSPDETAQILYTNKELREKLESLEIPLDPKSLNILCPEEPAPEDIFYEAYHGTLREVLRQWGDRMGFTFYWDPGSPQGADVGEDKGSLTFLDLTDGLMYTELEQTAKKMLEACNLLESTKSVSMVNTFNKAISANYVNEGIGLSEQQDHFMILDLLTLPIRGCVTDTGKEYPIGEFKGGWAPGDPNAAWRAENTAWYKEWANPNYIITDEDSTLRYWEEYSPQRPATQDSSEEEEIFRDYIRLVKAAAIGEDFFQAYVFWKSMKASTTINSEVSAVTLDEYIASQTTTAGVKPSTADALATLYASNQKITPAANGDPAAALTTLADAKSATADSTDGFFIAIPKALNNAGGFTVAGEGDSKILIPDLVENKALTIILSDNPTNSSPSIPTENNPNVKICRGTVLGKNCLTVRPLDPSYQAVQNLYNEAGNVGASTRCNGNNKLLDIELVEDAGTVHRTFKRETPVNKAVDTKNGSPYIFTYTHQHGNSMALNGDVQSTLYKQLKYIAENAGRFWVSPEILTRREFNQRNYNEDGVKFVNRFLDVNDSVMRGLFQEFDPLAGEAQRPFSQSEYDKFMGTDFTKSAVSTQKQLNGFSNLEPPTSPPPLPCDYGSGEEFNPQNTKTSENTMAPTIQQMILKVIEKTYPQSVGCSNESEATDIIDAAFSQVDLVPATESGKFMLKSNYYSPNDFNGGAGYSESDNDGAGPTITVEGGAGLSIKTIVDRGVIAEIVIENPGDALFEGVDGAPPTVNITISSPVGGTINFFKNYSSETTMEYMDSITSSNLNIRNQQKEIACCCTDLEQGVVLMDKGSQLTLPYGDAINKSISRLSSATNRALAGNRQANIVRDYAADGKVVTFSTNLIPRNALSGGSPDSIDELDWIVDQVRIGADGTDPTFIDTKYVMPKKEGDNNYSGAECMMDTEVLPYLVRNNKFEMMALCVPQDDGEGNVIKPTIPGLDSADGIITDCSGITAIAQGINAKEMQIEFVTPNNEDLKLEFGCGEAWQDLSESQKQEKLEEIRKKLIDFVKSRAYMHRLPSYEASVTIADNFLLNAAGAPIVFNANDGIELGVPSIKQGLESLSVKVDGSGLRISINLSTKKKHQAIKKNFNEWRDFNPRISNQLIGGVDQE